MNWFWCDCLVLAAPVVSVSFCNRGWCRLRLAPNNHRLCFSCFCSVDVRSSPPSPFPQPFHHNDRLVHHDAVPSCTRRDHCVSLVGLRSTRHKLVVGLNACKYISAAATFAHKSFFKRDDVASILGLDCFVPERVPSSLERRVLCGCHG